MSTVWSTQSGTLHGTVTLNVFNWTPPDWPGAESVQVIPSDAVSQLLGRRLLPGGIRH